MGTGIKRWSLSLCALLPALWGCRFEYPEPRPDPPTEPPTLGDIVVNEDWARVLGKALFWDQQVGSDGMACASCHYHAGADVRIIGQLSPGLNELPSADAAFGAIEPAERVGLLASGSVGGPLTKVVAADFPFHQLADPEDRNSDVISTTNDRLTSSGSHDNVFVRVDPHSGFEECVPGTGNIFVADGLGLRQTEPRHTPTVVDAVFFPRLFWDGRANNTFNGVDPFGRRAHVDPTNRILVMQDDGYLSLEALAIPNAALASQSVGPPVNSMEMSCEGRTFPDIGRKMLHPRTRPLREQEVHPRDSVLGAPGPFGNQRHPSGKGLKRSYKELIELAFDPRFWAADGRWRIAANGHLVESSDGYSQMELNFSLFWGLAIMLYEETLVSADTRWDRAQPCVDDPSCDPVARGLLTELELDGFQLFGGGFGPDPGGRCVACHAGNRFSTAAASPDEDPVFKIQRPEEPDSIGLEVPTLHDGGFLNIGVRPVHEDLGIGGVDPYGFPLSFTRQYKAWRESERSIAPIDDVEFDPCDFENDPFGVAFDLEDCTFEPTGPDVRFERIQVDGAMKSPSLRNVALTPPYFHYGGYASLEQVVEFYAHGGNRRDMGLTHAGRLGDNSGSGPFGEDGVPYDGEDHGSNVSGNVTDLNLALGDGKDQRYGIDALVAFMKTLTDRRLQCDQAPFDHPSLTIFHGYTGKDRNRDGYMDDRTFVLPAVGEDGYDPSSGLCIPNAGDLFAPGMLARVGGEPSDPSEFE